MSSIQNVYKNVSSWIRHRKTSTNDKTVFFPLKSILVHPKNTPLA